MAADGERELYAQAIGGDRAAFDRLRQRLEPRVRRFVVRLVGQSAAEEDILQDAFLSLYLNMARIHPAENLLPFLYRIVRNRCYDELRRQGRFQMVSLDQSPSETDISPFALLDTRPPPDQALIWSLAFAEIRKAMDRLPEPQRQAMILFCEEDLSYEQIATAMGTDVGTVKSRIHYGRRHLRRLLRPDVLQTFGIHEEGPHDRHAARNSRCSHGRLDCHPHDKENKHGTQS